MILTDRKLTVLLELFLDINKLKYLRYVPQYYYNAIIYAKNSITQHIYFKQWQFKSFIMIVIHNIRQY